MTPLFLAALLTGIPVNDPSSLIPEFITAISAGDAEMAAAMISPEAIVIIDSLLLADPARIMDAVAVFGLPELEADSIDSAMSLLLELFRAPVLPIMIGLTGVAAGETFESAGRTFVPVTWAVFSEMNTVFIEISSLSENPGDWRIMDFYTTDPRPHSRSTRASCSPR